MKSDLEELKKDHYKLINGKDNKRKITLNTNNYHMNKNNNRNGCRQNKNFTGPCNNCGVNRHKMRDCWVLESNAYKRLKQY